MPHLLPNSHLRSGFLPTRIRKENSPNSAYSTLSIETSLRNRRRLNSIDRACAVFIKNNTSLASTCRRRGEKGVWDSRFDRLRQDYAWPQISDAQSCLRLIDTLHDWIVIKRESENSTWDSRCKTEQKGLLVRFPYVADINWFWYRTCRVANYYQNLKLICVGAKGEMWWRTTCMSTMYSITIEMRGLRPSTFISRR